MDKTGRMLMRLRATGHLCCVGKGGDGVRSQNQTKMAYTRVQFRLKLLFFTVFKTIQLGIISDNLIAILSQNARFLRDR